MSSNLPENYIIRFRSVEKLLNSQTKELKNQELFLSKSIKLNDPMEGFSSLYWKGDEILWKNLINHYILCLYWSIQYYLIDNNKNFEKFVCPAYIPINLLSQKRFRTIA
jgi:hypothetical protein